MLKRLRYSLQSLLVLSSLAFRPTPASADELPAWQPQANTLESFDTGAKATYPAATVALGTGNWTLTAAVLGNTPDDRKLGTQAVRLQQSGKLTMEFFLTSGAGSVTVQHGIYGTDASSSWELWAQAASCNCNKWTKVGNTVFTTTGTLQAVSFTVNIAGNVKFEIRKTSGGSARLNIDEFEVTGYDGTAPKSIDNDNLAMGNPSGATADASYPNNYLLVKPQFAIGYNRDQGKPNWVSWHLDIANRGTSERQDNFAADAALPAGWYQAQPTSYQGSGFDRGHNCPSADRNNTDADNTATFLMTNMMPQAPNNNQQTWGDLEGYCRTLLPNNEVYIICGSYGVGGTGLNGYMTTLDNGRITVPNRTWKVIVVLPVGDDDVARVSAATRVIAVDMPNSNAIDRAWGNYRTTVDAIEKETGYDLLSALPVSVQAALESKVDSGPVQ